MIELDGSQHSGSGTIVRQAIAFSALTGHALHIRNVRSRRDKPGLRRQHIRVVQAIADLVNGTADGLQEGSREIMFRPGRPLGGRGYHWDIGSAGSTTMLALTVLPVLAFACEPTSVQIRGGVFQDFAPLVLPSPPCDASALQTHGRRGPDEHGPSGLCSTRRRPALASRHTCHAPSSASDVGRSWRRRTSVGRRAGLTPWRPACGRTHGWVRGRSVAESRL